MENTDFNLERFLSAQQYSYDMALQEIRAGHKRTHWIWYVFPQLLGLGCSINSRYYGIRGRDEALAYLRHPLLGARLREATMALLQHRGRSAKGMLGGIDAIKVRSCMTLFDAVSPDDIFRDVLDTFYDGQADRETLERI